jgi:YHS domain-containing protein
MISAFIREFVIPLLFFLFLRSILRSVFGGFRRPAARTAPPPAPPPIHSGGVLHRDPVCGTYVSSDSAIAQNIDGQTVYFCSPECRDKYRAR